jgi:hypothetical protein
LNATSSLMVTVDNLQKKDFGLQLVTSIWQDTLTFIVMAGGRMYLHVISCNGIMAFKISVGNPEGERLFGRSRRGRKDNIKMHHKWIGHKDVDWICLFRIGFSDGLFWSRH